MHLLKRTEAELKNLLSAALESYDVPAKDIDRISFDVPKIAKFGDLTSNIVMILSKKFKIRPLDMANKVLQNLNSFLEANSIDYIEKINVEPPGFINFYFKKFWSVGVLKEIQESRECYAKPDIPKKRVIVEFVSANPTGPMTIGNARGGAVGDSIASLLEFVGYEVTREFYLNDFGNQINNYGLSIEARYLELLNMPFVLPENGYKSEDVKDRAKEFIDLYGDAFLNVDSKKRREKLLGFAITKNADQIKETLLRYRINYDNWFKESELHKSGSVSEIIKRLTDLNFTYLKDSAIFLKCRAVGVEKDEVLVRQNGIPTYLAPDIAYHKNKLIDRNFDMAIDVFGADHHGYQTRLHSALKMLNVAPDRLLFVLTQLVRLVSNGQTVKVSKRTGNAITLSDLLDEIDVNAVRFFFILKHPASHMDFDMELAKAQNNDNPVYYVQYAYARMCGIVKICKKSGFEIPFFHEIDPMILESQYEIDLMKKLITLPSEIENAVKFIEPCRVAKYLIELAGLFHVFYAHCKVVEIINKKLTLARLKLVESVKIVMENLLKLLKIDAPETM